MTHTEKSSLIHQYAAGELSWHTLRERGFENYLEVLAALAEHGLKYPLAPMTGPNVAARERGIAILTERFNAQTSP